MLRDRLIGANPASAGELTFVGGAFQIITSSQTPTYSLTSLSGGVASSPSAGDIVIACVTFANATNRNIQCTTSGYTEIADLFSLSGGISASQLGVYFKVLSSAETSVQFNLGVSTNSTFVVHVWRGVDQTTPLDATTTTATDATAIPDAPEITTVSANAVVIAIGSNLGGNTFFGLGISDLTAPSGMENFFQRTIAAARGIGIASIYRPSAGAYDPPAFGGGNASTILRYCAVTVALRPE